MTRTQIYIEEEMLQQAKITAQSDGLNLSQFIRKLLKNSLDTSNSNNSKNKNIIPIRITKLKTNKTVYISRDHNDIYD
jgi:hypothetical protein